MKHHSPSFVVSVQLASSWVEEVRKAITRELHPEKGPCAWATVSGVSQGRKTMAASRSAMTVRTIFVYKSGLMGHTLTPAAASTGSQLPEIVPQVRSAESPGLNDKIGTRYTGKSRFDLLSGDPQSWAPES